MSLLIKALQKAEQSKESKDASVAGGLTLELAPQEDEVKPTPAVAAPASAADNSGLSLEQAPIEAPVETPVTIAEPAAPAPIAETVPAIPSAPESVIPADEYAASLADEAGFAVPIAPIPSAPAAKAAAPKKPAAKSEAAAVMTEAATATESAAPAVANQDVQRHAAAGLLTVGAAAKPAATNRRSLWMGLVGLVLLLLVGGGFYYYLQTLNQPELITVAPRPQAAPAPDSMMPPPAPSSTPPAELVAEEPIVAEPVMAELAQPAEKPAAMEVASAPAMATETPVEAKPRTKRKSAANAESNAINVAKLRKGEPTVDATHMAAYQAYEAGDDAAATRLYRQVIQADSRNVDAWLGLAAVAARQDRTEEAAAHYQRVLELEPRNSTAQAGLVALLGQASPVEAESRIKTLLAQQPDAANLHAALGNVYAEQNQWPNAQQAYFQAFNLDPSSAEYAFNLAVSLDQLRKPDLALDYYQKALALATRQGGAIDKVALESRISQLRSALGK
jgi:Tfp pilus assembly protein PilF